MRYSHRLSPREENFKKSFQGKVRIRKGAKRWQSIDFNKKSSPKINVLQSQKRHKEKILKQILDYKAFKLKEETEREKQQKILEKEERK